MKRKFYVVNFLDREEPLRIVEGYDELRSLASGQRVSFKTFASRKLAEEHIAKVSAIVADLTSDRSEEWPGATVVEEPVLLGHRSYRRGVMVDGKDFYPTIRAAADACGLSYQKVYALVNNQRKRKKDAFGRVFRYATESEAAANREAVKEWMEKHSPKRQKLRPIADEDGRIFQCIEDAARFHHVHRSSVGRCANGQLEHVGPHRFRFLTDEERKRAVRSGALRVDTSYFFPVVMDDREIFWNQRVCSDVTGEAKANICKAKSCGYTTKSGHTFREPTFEEAERLRKSGLEHDAL